MALPPVVGPVLVASTEVSDGPGTERERAHAAGRILLAKLIRALDCPDTAIRSHCEVCGSDAHGRPLAASGTVLLSVAYATGRVVAAAAPASAGRAIGVDIESDRGPGPLHELEALFAPHDPPDVRNWTVIEAALKADGRGLRIPPHLVGVGAGEPGDILPGGGRVTVPGRGSRIEAAPAPAPAGYVISVAIDPGSELSHCSMARRQPSEVC